MPLTKFGGLASSAYSVSIQSTTPTADELGRVSGVFTVTRSGGDPNKPLSVGLPTRLTVTGTGGRSWSGLGKPLGEALKELIGTVSPRTFAPRHSCSG